MQGTEALGYRYRDGIGDAPWRVFGATRSRRHWGTEWGTWGVVSSLIH